MQSESHKPPAVKRGRRISRSLTCAAGLILATMATSHAADGPVAGNSGGKSGSAQLRPGSVIKDCPTCPDMVVIPAGSFEYVGNDAVRLAHHIYGAWAAEADLRFRVFCGSELVPTGSAVAAPGQSHECWHRKPME
jgi:hypothetical protein